MNLTWTQRITRRTRLLGPALALLTVTLPAPADYVSQTSPLGTAGSVLVEAYDGLGAAGGSLNAGEVRLTFSRHDLPPGGPGDSAGPTFHTRGFQVVGFNTDLSLTADQITGPAGWVTSPGAIFGDLGAFNWALSTATAYQNHLSVLITGLGANATPGHFLHGGAGGSGDVPVPFAGQWLNIHLGPDGQSSTEIVGGPGALEPAPEPTPEPTSVALGGFGLLGLAVRRLVRRARRRED